MTRTPYTIDVEQDDGSIKQVTLPSVTEIISHHLAWGSDSLRSWACWLTKQGRDPELEAKQAADSGTTVHAAIEAYLNGVAFKWPAFSDNEKQCFVAWLSWWNARGMRVVLTEERILDLALGYAGTIDCVARDRNNKLCLLDWKTTSKAKQPKPKWFVQTSAYVGLWNANFEEPIDRVVIVDIARDTHQVSEIEHTRVHDFLRVFESLLEIQRITERLVKV